MSEAIEHDFDYASGAIGLRDCLDRRGGINGWNLASAVEVGEGDFALFWSRKSPAIPNTTPSQTLSKEFTP